MKTKIAQNKLRLYVILGALCSFGITGQAHASLDDSQGVQNVITSTSVAPPHHGGGGGGGGGNHGGGGGGGSRPAPPSYHPAPPSRPAPPSYHPAPPSRPPENRQPITRPPERRPPDNRNPITRPPENRQPITRPPERRPPENRQPITRPPERRPPDNRNPITRPPERRPPDGRPGHNQPIPPGHGDNMRRGQDRMDHMRGDHRVNDHVGRESREYNQRWRHDVEYRHHDYDHYWNRYHPYYDRYWYPHHFWGYYWALTVELSIDRYYYNPFICWFYCSTYDPYFYQRYYGNDYNRYNDPVWHQPFYRNGVFIPTTSFRDLLIGAGAWSVSEQYALRVGLTQLVQNLEAQLGQDMGRGVVLGRNDVAVTHFQLLNGAVVLYGTVTTNGVSAAFTSLVYLDGQGSNITFVPNPYDSQPSAQEEQQLNYLNDAIVQAGGNIENP